MENFVLCGPEPYSPLSKETLGRKLYESLNDASDSSICLIDGFSTDQKLSNKQLLEKSIKLALFLREEGYAGQDTVMAVSSENNLDYFLPVLSSLFNGSIIAPINFFYTSHELEHVLSISKPKIIFCAESGVRKFVEIRKYMTFIEKIIIIDSQSNRSPSSEDVIYMQDLLNEKSHNAESSIAHFQPVDGDSSKMAAAILCSSGTTGLPKGVVLSHLNIMVRLNHNCDPRYQMTTKGAHLVGLMPFFHIYGFSLVLGAIVLQQTVICMRIFDPNIFLESIQEFRIKELHLAPPLALFLTKSPFVGNYNLSSVEDMFCGAAPLSRDVEEKLLTIFKGATVRQVYGFTEFTACCTFTPFNDIKIGACGKVVPMIRAKVVDPENENSLGPHQTGELWFKGPSMMLGYYRNEEATREVITHDGWARSGDLGYYDEDGFFYVVDRLKDLIKFKGYQVAPAELENSLLKHPYVLDAGVIGVPDEEAGERPFAFVVKKPDCTVTEEDIKQYVAGLVSPQKRLSGGIRFVDSIPKNPSGKILRRTLRSML